MHRCDWATSELLIEYHDTEWGVFTLDEVLHFEQICLSGFQAGLSWEIVLKKRAFLREAFAGFVPEKVARFDESMIARIARDARGIRNVRKVRSVVNNARAFLELTSNHGSFPEFVLDFLGGAVRTSHHRSWSEVPSSTAESEALSKLLRGHGFTFFGPTIAYAYLQSVGFVNDHIISCFRRDR
ncbi:MAG: DNA-3-methyladenine glycosylase I [Candidatus Coatesbacteria bacterium]|nr:MAG: DNA-3-methyladenine glycosylase I [Candidatus Coatesbacteria bacterium]